MGGRRHNINSMRKRRMRKCLLAEQAGRCFWCRQSLLDHEVTLDHLLPRSKGGGNERANIVAAHRNCNQGRADTVWPFGKTPPIVDHETGVPR